MGSITFRVVGDASVGDRAKTFTVSDENINRLVAYAKAENPALTTPQALAKWADYMMAITKERVLGHERTVAAVAPFDAT